LEENVTMHEAKLQAIQVELNFYGYAINGSEIASLESNYSENIDLFCQRLTDIQKDQLKKLKEEWEKVETNVKAIAGGISVQGLRVLQKCFNYIKSKSQHAVLKDRSCVKHIRKLSCLAADRMSHSTAEQAAVVLSKIELYEYNVKKLGYIKYLIKSYLKYQSASQVKIATGVDINSSIQGPYSNLDLPMQERVFRWSDVDEETYARQDAKQKQRRYQMGLEDNSSSDAKVGFYWRELRNEPYAFRSGSEEMGYETSYPYRANLWGNP
jgi:hypothetical protein